ncbi:hypothetical protein SPMU_32670 [Sphingomonas mucosissima]|uniref:Uncharacterized protein n=1 Tax=Sphingomonas mucosissima TaxID=370959 RepID=A0A245ZE48_9SPHN|nr:hypothetical protein SPMU_32670 [Sphingomonas mucosissima]
MRCPLTLVFSQASSNCSPGVVKVSRPVDREAHRWGDRRLDAAGANALNPRDERLAGAALFDGVGAT